MKLAAFALTAAGLIASTRLTLTVVAVVVMFCAVTFDAARRARRLEKQMNVVNSRLDDQADVIADIRRLAGTIEPPIV
jgi:hypothetical protein